MEQTPKDPSHLEGKLAEARELLDPGLIELCTFQLMAQNPEASSEEIQVGAVKAAIVLEAASKLLENGDITSFTGDMGIKVGDTVLDFSGELHETTDFDHEQDAKRGVKQAEREEQ